MKKPIGFWGWLLRITAVGYPVGLLVFALLLRLVGERWWVTTVALYLPRWVLALPLPFLIAVLLYARARRLLASQLVAIVLLLFPIFGWRLSLFGGPTAGATHLRVLSFNIAGGGNQMDAIAAAIREAAPDVICLQEAWSAQGSALAAALPGYHFHTTGQFTMGSRFPIAEVYEPPKLEHEGLMRTTRFIRYRLATPGGLIQLYNVHPPSPRAAFEDLRGAGLRAEITSGRIFGSTKAGQRVVSMAQLRGAQMRSVAEDAALSPYPVIIAGDTNLPGLSWILGHYLGGFQDGFSAAGTGFGYTFPTTKRPWMRIDRVFADGRLRFLKFAVFRRPGSDHFPVVADLELVGR